ncbi:hypothetical protein Btru_010401 [Bulinus truncatus]|nr:hypothetical protein Btru_010401 [Bulinus truncatus]
MIPGFEVAASQCLLDLWREPKVTGVRGTAAYMTFWLKNMANMFFFADLMRRDFTGPDTPFIDQTMDCSIRLTECITGLTTHLPSECITGPTTPLLLTVEQG